MNTRKNLMVDSRKIRRLATRLGTSESEAVRRAVDAFLASGRPAVAWPPSGGAANALTRRGLTNLLRAAPVVDKDFADDLERLHSSQSAALEAFRRWPS